MIALGPDGHLYIPETFGRRITRLEGPIPTLQVAGEIIASTDGSTFFEFSGGRHVRTWDALTRRKLLEFTYDPSGLITAVTDGDGNITHVERAADGTATAIVSPDGDRTTLSTDTNGFLSAIMNGAADTVRLTHTSSGRLTNLVDPKGQEHRFTYSVTGELRTDTAPDSSSTTLAVDPDPVTHPYRNTQSSAEGRSTVRDATYNADGTTVRTNTTPDGLVATTTLETNGRQTLTTPQGVTTTSVSKGDPRFGMQAPLLKSLVVRMPSGATMTTTATRTITLADPLDPLTLASKVDSVSVNGKVTVSTYNAAARTITTVSPEGRASVTTLDATNRPVQVQRPGLAPIVTGYDARGRVSTVTQAGRTTTFTYGSNGRLSQTQDPIGRVTLFTYDSAGRLLTTRRPDGQVLAYGYDRNGNRTRVTPPGQPAHQFAFTKGDLLESYTAPAVGGVAPVTRFAYNRDRQLTRITRPDSVIIEQTYDAAGRPRTYTRPDGTTTFDYDPTTGMLTQMTASGAGGAMSYTYDGTLMKTITTTGVAATDLAFGYDTEFRVNSVGVHGNVVTFTYDRDGLMNHAGALALGRSAATGQIVSTTLSGVHDTITYDAFGAVSADTSRSGTTFLYGYAVTRDSLQRIITKTESVRGTSARFDYRYDSVSRLVEVKQDGAVTASYQYDANGNRLNLTTSTGSVTGTYDAQDRLVTYGSAAYGYSGAGELRFRTLGADTTRYRFDALGMLRGVTLSSGTTVDYTLDAMNRRVGRSVNGTVTQRYAYSGTLGPAAEIDASGNVVTRFVYGTHANVPDYMVRAGVTYRFVVDASGSVRMVVDVATGTSAQELDYDEFGRVTRDTHVGFQPFGYAGGIYDETTGLVHFGVREFDAETGRWLSKDPIGFGGGDPNLYAYSLNDPTNVGDIGGRCPPCLILLGEGVGGAATDLAIQLLLSGGDLSCVNWREVAGAGIIAAATSGIGEILGEIASEANRVRLFRAVDENELRSILEEGTYGSSPSMGGKYFALTREGAENFANAGINAGRDITITSTTVPRSVFNEGFLFNDPGANGAGASIHFAQDFLRSLYDAIGPIKIH
jgi:RHS repeat-associated protein